MKLKSISTVLLLCIAWAALAQGSSDERHKMLAAKQATVRLSQDSLQKLLTTSRELFGSAQGEAKATLSADIVRLEGEIFDIRTRLGRIDSDIAQIEESYAAQSLNQDQTAQRTQSAVLHQNAFFTDNLSKRDIATLAAAQKIESQTIVAISAISPLYIRLKELQAIYLRSFVQSEVDSMRSVAEQIKHDILKIDNQAGAQWLESYNYLLGIYLVLLDRAPHKERSTVEAIEVESSQVRRAETFAQQNSLIAQLSAFDQQRNLLLSYQRAIAKAAGLNQAHAALMARKNSPVQTAFADIDFLPRVLTLYGTVQVNFSYSSDNPSDFAQLIVPPRGVYYTILISTLSAPAKSNEIFRKVWPIQCSKGGDGKYRYYVGGFHTYAQALKGVSILGQVGFRSPAISAWFNGQSVSTSKAREAEKTIPAEHHSDGYNVVVRSEDSSVAEKLRAVIDMHAKGKSIARVVEGKELIFTISEFSVREQAEVIAQILRERTAATVIVEPTRPAQSID